MRLKIFLILLICMGVILSANTAIGAEFWQRMSTPFFDSVKTMAIDLTGRIFAGFCMSTDGGISWSGSITGSQPYSMVTAQDNSNLAALGSNGIYRRLSQGSYWDRVSTQASYGPFGIDGQGHIYAGTTIWGLFRSDDNGASWYHFGLYLPTRDFCVDLHGNIVCVYGGRDSVYYYNVASNQWRNTARLGFNAKYIRKTPAGMLFSVNPDTVQGGVYASNDSGLTWQRILNARDITGISLRNQTDIYVSTKDGHLNYSPNNGENWQTKETPANSIIAMQVIADSIIWLSSYEKGVLQSTDLGNNWETIGPTFPDVRAICFGPSNEVYAATIRGLFKFENSTYTWLKLYNEYRGISDVTIDSAGRILINLLDGGGVRRSPDNGVTWDTVTSLPSFSRMLYYPNGEIFAVNASGYYDGLYRSTDNGLNWELIYSNNPIRDIIMASDGSLVIDKVNSASSDIFRSTDLGASWIRAESTYITYTLAGDGTGTLWAAGYSVLKSTDNGISWRSIAESHYGGPFVKLIYCAGGDLIGITSYDLGTFTLNISRDGGSTWSTIRSAYSTPGLNSAISTSQGKIVMGCNGPNWSNGILISRGVISDISDIWPGDMDNNGLVEAADILPLAEHWQQSTPARDAVDFRWIPRIDFLWQQVPDEAYADANGNGIVDISDFLAIGLNWHKTHPVTGTIIKYDSNLNITEKQVLLELLKSVRGGNGEFSSELQAYIEGLLSGQTPENISLFDNYPNPFNSETIIRYSLASASKVEIKIFDINGRLVKYFPSINQLPGAYQVVWNGTNNCGLLVGSGVYFLRLECEGRAKAIKTVLLK